MRRAIVHMVLFVLSWVAGAAGTLALFADAPARLAYAIIVGWWLSLFVASKARMSALLVLPLGAGYLAVFLLLWVAGRGWLYRDIWGVSLSSAVFTGAVQASAFVAPILLNSLVDVALAALGRAPTIRELK